MHVEFLKYMFVLGDNIGHLGHLVLWNTWTEPLPGLQRLSHQLAPKPINQTIQPLKPFHNTWVLMLQTMQGKKVCHCLNITTLSLSLPIYCADHFAPTDKRKNLSDLSPSSSKQTERDRDRSRRPKLISARMKNCQHDMTFSKTGSTNTTRRQWEVKHRH